MIPSCTLITCHFLQYSLCTKQMYHLLVGDSIYSILNICSTIPSSTIHIYNIYCNIHWKCASPKMNYLKDLNYQKHSEQRVLNQCLKYLLFYNKLFRFWATFFFFTKKRNNGELKSFDEEPVHNNTWHIAFSWAHTHISPLALVFLFGRGVKIMINSFWNRIARTQEMPPLATDTLCWGHWYCSCYIYLY